MIEFREPSPSDNGQSFVKTAYSNIVARQHGYVIWWQGCLKISHPLRKTCSFELRHHLWFSLVWRSFRVESQCMIRNLTIVKHLVSSLTKVYDRQAFCPTAILVCFHLKLCRSHHQCVKMIGFLGTNVICSGLPEFIKVFLIYIYYFSDNDFFWLDPP